MAKQKRDTSQILVKVQDAINEILPSHLTLRQIFYRLVTWKTLENTKPEYKTLSRILVKARKQGRIPYDVMEDETRPIENFYDQDFEEVLPEVESMLDFLDSKEINFSATLYQTVLHLLGVEKQALQRFFRESLPEDKNVLFIVCKGYNSLTQLHVAAEKIKRMLNKGGIEKAVCSYFGDHDPSGLDIARNFRKQLEEQLEFPLDEFALVAITKEQIAQYHIPGDHISKKKDSRNAGWNPTEGEAVELNAFPPVELRKLIQAQFAKYWDAEIAREVARLQPVITRRFRKLLLKELYGKYGGTA